MEALHKNEMKIRDRWTLLRIPLAGHNYMALWLTGDDLRPYNPFRLLADALPDAGRDMANSTIVVVGFTRIDGTKGFVLLANEVSKESGDLPFGEILLDDACHIAPKAGPVHGSR
jgi:CDP-diacylglycerol pyrophosphatase